jgi:hypothetical protein
MENLRPVPCCLSQEAFENRLQIISERMKTPISASYEAYLERCTRLKDHILRASQPFRYVLIGEAPPSTGKYIYVDAKGAYITAALKASGFDPRKMNREQRQHAFANAGYLLLDIIPFPLVFRGKLRRSDLLMEPGILALFKSDLEQQIKCLVQTGILDENFQFVLVAPETTSSAMLDELYKAHGGYFAGKPISHACDLLIAPDFVDRSGRRLPSYTSSAGSMPSVAIGHLPKRARMAVCIGATGPHALLISRALGLDSF